MAEQGCVNLGSLLKVTAEYNAKGNDIINESKNHSVDNMLFCHGPVTNASPLRPRYNCNSVRQGKTTSGTEFPHGLPGATSFEGYL